MNNVSFRVHRGDLADAVGWVARSLPTKPAQAVLRAMVIDANEDGLNVSGYDHETSARTTARAEVSKTGRVAVAGKLLSDIVATMPNRDVDVSTDESKMRLVCGASRFELPIVSLEDYPRLPDMPGVVGEVDPVSFAGAVSQVSSAVARDNTLPMLTGVHVTSDGRGLTLAATDRFRLAVRKVPWTPAVDDRNVDVLVPSKALVETSRALDTSVPVKLAVDGGGIFGVHVGARETTARLLDADFPNVTPLLPQSHSCVATADTAMMLESIKRVSLVADRNAQIVLRFTPGGVELSASGSDLGRASESIPGELHGADEFTTAFNAGYLRDGLQIMPSERVMFGFTNQAKPAIIIPQPSAVPDLDGESYVTPATDLTYLLTPVRLPG